jgi:hypothetical protein
LARHVELFDGKLCFPFGLGFRDFFHT